MQGDVCVYINFEWLSLDGRITSNFLKQIYYFYNKKFASIVTLKYLNLVAEYMRFYTKLSMNGIYCVVVENKFL